MPPAASVTDSPTTASSPTAFLGEALEDNFPTRSPLAAPPGHCTEEDVYLYLPASPLQAIRSRQHGDLRDGNIEIDVVVIVTGMVASMG
jgi:hypothetical protein